VRKKGKQGEKQFCEDSKALDASNVLKVFRTKNNWAGLVGENEGGLGKKSRRAGIKSEKRGPKR